MTGNRTPRWRSGRWSAPEPLPGPVVDAHTHLDACGCVDTPDEVEAAMARAAAVEVTRVITVGDDLASAPWVATAATLASRSVRGGRAAPDQGRQLDETTRPGIALEAGAQPRVVAIGETGLDHYWDAAPHDVQVEAFAWHIDLAKRLGKPLMIHDRDAHDDVLGRPATRGRTGRR